MRYFSTRYFAAFAALATLVASAALVGDGIYWP
jgi:hypothetical protein